MTFKEATAIFTVYANNFKFTHWAATGNKFDRIHSLSEDCYNMLSEDLDVLAEMALRLDQTPALIMDAVEVLKNYPDHGFIIITEFTDVDYDKFCYISNIMLSDICWSIEKLLENEEINQKQNVGIRSTLEGLHDKYDLQCRYLNKRRSSEAKN